MIMETRDSGRTQRVHDVKQERWSTAIFVGVFVTGVFLVLSLAVKAFLSSRAILALALVATLSGCTSAQLAADEAKASAALTAIHTAISSGASLAAIQQLSTDAAAADPSSPVLAKIAATAKSAKTAKDVQDLDVGVQGGIAVLGLVKAP